MRSISRRSRFGNMGQYFPDDLLDLRFFQFQVSQVEPGSPSIIPEFLSKHFVSALSPVGIGGSLPLTQSCRKSTPREVVHPLLVARSAILMPSTKSSLSFRAAVGTGLAVQFVPPRPIGGVL